MQWAVRQKSYESDAPEQSAVKPLENKAEGNAPQPAVAAPEEKDKAETETPVGGEKKKDHAGHNMDEMSKDKE